MPGCGTPGYPQAVRAALCMGLVCRLRGWQGLAAGQVQPRRGRGAGVWLSPAGEGRWEREGCWRGGPWELEGPSRRAAWRG